MKREERADAIRFFKEVAEKEVDGAKYSKLAIEALEQEPILDKIRAEIEELRKAPLISWASSEMIIDTILKILDEYKAESEEI